MTQGLNKVVGQVREFHSAFGHPVADKVTPISIERATARAIWSGEEALVEFIHQSSRDEDEFLDAYDKLLDGLDKAKEKSLSIEYPKTPMDEVVGQSDALVDAFYFLAGTFVELGIEPQALFDIVQEANMAKLGADGKPIVRESDGKIMKPEGWEPPETKLEAEILRQVQQKNG